MSEASASQPYSKAERLLNLLMALRSSRVGLSRDQIRAQVRGYDPDAAGPAFERMFERDKDELRSLGVPVTTLTDPNGVVTGYRLEGDWALEPLRLDPAELATLALAARLWAGGDLAPAATNALRKVEARLGMRSETMSSPPLAGLAKDSPVLPALIDACSRRATLRFGYRKPGSDTAEQRTVQPWGVVSWRGHWYLVGHDLARGSRRVFRASRIVEPVHADANAAAYDVPADFDPRTAVGHFEDEATSELLVAVAPGTGAALRRVSSSRGSRPDGSELLAMDVHDLANGVAHVLASTPDARIVGPDEALELARSQLEAVIAGQRSPAARPGGMLRPRAAASSAGSAQFERLLALVPWLAANSGVSVEAAAAHFDVTQQQLLADLGSIVTSGPDDWRLFDIQYWDDDGIIEVIDALELSEPLTLTPDEGFALLAALKALAAVPGGHDRAILASTEAALTRALGGRAAESGAVAVRVDLPDDVVGPIQGALAGSRAVELTYLGAVRDSITQRVVDPVGIVVIDGLAYLRGFCRSAQGLRLFRLDRILEARISQLPAEPVEESAAQVEPMAAALAGTGRHVVVDVPGDSSLLDDHPTTRRWTLPGGWIRAELPIGDFGWARRLVLGGGGRVVLREPQWLAERLLADALAAWGDL